MLQFINLHSSAVQASSAVVVALLTIVLAVATLRYVGLTKKIAAASVAQAEAVHKPVLTLKLDETVDIEITKLIDDSMKGKQHTCIGPTLEIVNIGTGPALQVTWILKRFSETGGFIPYVAEGQGVSLLVASKVKMGGIPTSFELQCRYMSLSGTKYISRTAVENSQEVSEFQITVET